MRGNVKAVQHMQRLARFGRDHRQVGPPHVGADKAQARNHRLPQGRQAPAQGGFGAALAHPQQTPARAVDLVDHRQEIIRPLALAPMDFVHPNRLDAFELAVGQAPVDKPRHRPIDAFPTGAKGPGRFPPGQPPRHSGKGSTSWRGSPAACPHSRAPARPPPRAADTAPAGGA